MIGVIHTIRAFLPLLSRSSIKKVVTISSGAGDPDSPVAAGDPLNAPYAISKQRRGGLQREAGHTQN